VDALFGKSSVTPQGQAQPYPQPLRQTAALDEDLESAELLDELAALTMQSAPKKLGYSPVHAPVQSETAGQDVDDELFGMVSGCYRSPELHVLTFAQGDKAGGFHCATTGRHVHAQS
jgi:hypothetical protein